MANSLDRLSECYGILPEYFDVGGTRHIASDETKRLLLAAMGVDASSIEAVERELQAEAERHRRHPLPPVVVWRVSQGVPSVRFWSDSHRSELEWRVEVEGGEVRSGRARPRHDGERFVVELCELPLGYHQLELLGETVSIIAVPDRGYLPELSERKLWGIAVQLYGLVSPSNWGIGDCGDLLAMTGPAGSAGAAFIGLNPLHALFPSDPSNPSPYSPNSRLARNIFYIDPRQLPEFERLIAKEGPEQARVRCVAAAEVAYPEVYQTKLALFERLYRLFKLEGQRTAAFREWKEQADSSMLRFAIHEALTEKLRAEDPARWGWPVWPSEFQNPESDAVKQFAAENSDRIDFHLFLQWTLDQQLGVVSETLKSRGVSLGLYHDLALGSNGGGAELWAQQELYATKASMGAPPDPLGPQGQNWGLPPMIPRRLQERRYEPFIAVIRAAMRHGGALRLDHVMSLMRLFWIPAGRSAAEGAYVMYPFADLLGIVALESQRSRVVVIGEDLGTVPPEVQEGMARADLLSYKVFYFLKRDGRPVPPSEYPKHALVVTSTHDLPTLEGYFHHRDIEVRKALGIIADPSQVEAAHAERNWDVHCIEELVGEGAWREGGGLRDSFVAKVHGMLATAPSILQAVQLEDIAGELEQANLPGTVDEHPNWRRKLGRGYAEIFSSERWKLIAGALRAAGR